MATLFLDLSSSDIRILLTEGYRLVDVRTLEATKSFGDVKAVLQEVFAASGQQVEQAHLILPEAEVATTISKLQKMPLEDAAKVLLRQGAGTDVDSLSLQLTELDGPQHQLHCLAETVRLETIERYRKAFSAAGVRLETITSLSQSILAAFAPAQQEIQNVEVVFHISSSSITALFLANKQILSYERIVLPPLEGDQVDQSDPLRAMKRRQFAVLNPLHSVYSQFMQENPELIVDKIWLCGPSPGIEGVAESLTDATEVVVVLADQIADFEEGSCSFTALAGLLHVKDDPQRVNFIPAEQRETVRMRPQVLMAAVALVLILLAGILLLTTERRISSLRHDLLQAQKELEALDITASASKQLASNVNFLSGLNKDVPAFFELFRELAESLPNALSLDNIRYQHDEEKNTLELVVVAEYADFVEDAELLTALTTTLDRSGYLSSYSDPVINMVTDGDLKLVQISIVCALSVAGGAEQ